MLHLKPRQRICNSLVDFDWIKILFTIPKMMKVETIEEPPYDNKGNVTPAIGNRPMFIPILTNI